MLAKTAGFCYGVGRAVEMLEGLVKSTNKPIYMLGPFIHNPQIIEKFEKLGIKLAKSISEIPDDSVLVFRAHGSTEDEKKEAIERGLDICDTICPSVKKIHKIAEQANEQDSFLFIMGDRQHPEVIGIASRGPFEKTLVFSNLEELESYHNKNPQLTDAKITMIAQTTFNITQWEKCCFYAKKSYTSLQIFDTICKATHLRQKEAASLAKNSDVCVVIGGKNSSNTAKLVEICRSFCPHTIHIESAQQLEAKDFKPGLKVGITAGASTPVVVIKEVITDMSDLISNSNEEAFCFEEALEQSFKILNTGDRIKGLVVGVNPTEIQVDLGTKQAGYVPISEFSDDPTANISELVHVGDELELFVVRVNDIEGLIMLSKKKIDSIKGFDEIEKSLSDNIVLEGVVVDVVKGGLVVVSNGVRVFVPASHAGVSKDTDLNTLLRQNVRFKIIEVNKQRRRAVGSIRTVSREERKANEEKIWSELEVGKKYSGVVKSITSYGAFVDIGGIDGMVHISELSWSRIRHPSDVIKEGDVLEVYIKELNPETHRISLGYKQAENNPWELMKTKFNVGDVTKAKIIKMMPFGAFAQVIPGVDGLIHISQIADRRIAKPQDVLTVGEEVDVKITDIDYVNKKVSLSIRALLEPEVKEESAAEASIQESSEVFYSTDNPTMDEAIDEVPSEV